MGRCDDDHERCVDPGSAAFAGERVAGNVQEQCKPVVAVQGTGFRSALDALEKLQIFLSGKNKAARNSLKEAGPDLLPISD